MLPGVTKWGGLRLHCLCRVGCCLKTLHVRLLNATRRIPATRRYIHKAIFSVRSYFSMTFSIRFGLLVEVCVLHLLFFFFVICLFSISDQCISRTVNTLNNLCMCHSLPVCAVLHGSLAFAGYGASSSCWSRKIRHNTRGQLLLG